VTFTTTPLVSGGVLVEGTDSKGNDGTTILRSERWDAVVHIRTHTVATDEFNEMVEEFFKPLTDAADKAKALIAGPTSDWDMVTIKAGTEYEEAQVVHLDEDGILLRLLAEGQHDKLRWVNGDKLVATV